MAGHIIHLPVPTQGEPFGEPALGCREVRIRDADRLEAEFGAPTPYPLRKRRVIHESRA